MAFNNASRVFETSITQGTGPYTVLGAQPDHFTAVARVGNGNSAFFCAFDNVDEEWFLGTVTDGVSDTISRDVIISSTNGGSAVNWGPGTRNVICGWPPAIVNGFFSNLLGSGLMVQTGTKTSARRSIAGTAPIVIANGNGVSGNPTVSITLGAGLKALSNALVSRLPVTAIAATTTVTAAHRAQLLKVTAAATLNITAAATLGDDFFFAVRNDHSAAITIDPNGSEQIDGAATISLQPGESCFVVCNGSAFSTVGKTVTPSGTNLGASGARVFSGVSGSALQFRRLIGSGGITATENTNDITFTIASIPSASVGQAQLKTNTSEVSVGGNSTPLSTTFAGGEYGFWPTQKYSGISQLNHPMVGPSFNIWWDDAANAAEETSGTITTSYVNRVMLSHNHASATLFAQQRYVTASPPYDWGDGELAGFTFLKVQKGTGLVLAGWTAIDPPWAYNGPTRAKADVFLDPFGIPIGLWEALGKGTKIIPAIKARRTTESLAEARASGRMARYFDEIANGEEVFEAVTMERKMRDMAVLPQPFFTLNPSSEEVVLLDPLSAFMARASEAAGQLGAEGESLLSLVHAGDILFDNEDLAQAQKRGGPRGVMQVAARLR